MSHTYELIKIIGSPFIDDQPEVSYTALRNIYDRAFADRVALLYLSIHRRNGWPEFLEEKYQALNSRRQKTLGVISGLGKTLNDFNIGKYAIFKSLKPYPATPNDTDVIIFGDSDHFKSVINHLYKNEYLFHEWAPMQTTLIHPDGIGKTGKGKKGGIYYIDMYSNISTDYFLYINKESLIPFIEERIVNSQSIQNVRKEIELAIILFHNVFPERTFQLEHFYMPLYHLKEDDFDINVMIRFVESQKLSHAISTNLTLVEHIHKSIFGVTPPPIDDLLAHFGRNNYELDRFINNGESTPYMISPKTFWTTFTKKIRDKAALKSLLVQGLHMLHPIFFADVANSLRKRFSEKGTYHLE